MSWEKVNAREFQKNVRLQLQSTARIWQTKCTLFCWMCIYLFQMCIYFCNRPFTQKVNVSLCKSVCASLDNSIILT